MRCHPSKYQNIQNRHRTPKLLELIEVKTQSYLCHQASKGRKQIEQDQTETNATVNNVED